MRIDKYLKVSRIIKRRSVAADVCDGGRVTINGKIAKPSANVKAGDIIEIRQGERISRYEVLSTGENVRANEASQMYRLLE
ncbi:MAG TPA: RNA-binding S4 domain-containing protein [Clostridia bacterium]|nr:RNA-binding S4 domain-containing protein [Clostridia bacterium]